MLIGLDFVFAYIDNILIASLFVQEYRQHLKRVFGREIMKYPLTSKCKFQAESLEFLGFQIFSKGSAPLFSKIKTIFSYKRPERVQKLRRFLGTVNFYHRCISNVAQHKYLNEYFKDSEKKDKRLINWIAEAIKAFDKVKRDLTTLLVHLVPNIKMRLMTDVSGNGSCAGINH